MKKYDGLAGEILTGTFFANLLVAQVVGLSWLTWTETVLIMVACIALQVLVRLAFDNKKKDKED